MRRSLYAQSLLSWFEMRSREKASRRQYPKGSNAPLLERAQARLAAGECWETATAGLLPSEKAFLRRPEPASAPAVVATAELDSVAALLPGARRVNVGGEPLVIVPSQAL